MAPLPLALQPTSQTPELTPQFCFNQRALRDFLRLSRSTIDDSITQSLNALLTPSTTSPFDPSSTSSPARSPSFSSASSRHISSPSCTLFTANILYPSWKSRSDVLEYCARVATSPDPLDPVTGTTPRPSQEPAESNKIIDARTDPYALSREQPRTQALAELMRNETFVEGIVRARSWGVVRERCTGLEAEEKWEVGFERWRKQFALDENKSTDREGVR